MFLIDEKLLRKEIVSFYKKLKDTAKKTEGKIGSLTETPEAISEQTSIESNFQAIGSEAKTLTGKLDN